MARYMMELDELCGFEFICAIEEIQKVGFQYIPTVVMKFIKGNVGRDLIIDGYSHKVSAPYEVDKYGMKIEPGKELWIDRVTARKE